MSSGSWIAPLVAVVGLLSAATAHARPQGSGFYFGASGGQSKFDQDKGEMDSIVFQSFGGAGLPVLSVRSRIDESDTTFAGFAGYRFNRYAAIEGGYVDLGELKYDADVVLLSGFATLPGTMRLTATSKGALVSGMGIWPITPVWEVYGRGGVFFSDTEVKATGQFGTFSSTATDSKTAVDAMIGLGTAVHFGEHVLLRLEYQRFGAVGDEDATGETDVNLFNLGLVIRL